MKQADIKRLEKAVEHLVKASELLFKTYEHLYSSSTEPIYVGSSGVQRSAESLVKEMANDVFREKDYIEGKIRVFKDMLSAK